MRRCGSITGKDKEMKTNSTPYYIFVITKIFGNTAPKLRDLGP